MKQAIRLGIVCLARETYDFVAAGEIYKKIITEVQKTEAVDWTVIPIGNLDRGRQRVLGDGT